MGKGLRGGDCILYGLDSLGRECIKDHNINWDYYSLNDCKIGEWGNASLIETFLK